MSREKNQGTKKKKSGNLINIILVLILLTGLGIIAYPTFADWWNRVHQARTIAGYVERVAQMDRATFERMWADAEAYNENLRHNPNRMMMTEEEIAVYNSILDVTGTGVMAYIDIPKIDISLPIYHGTAEDILQIAIGHIVGTSFPVGGEGTHCAVSGHRGLPSAKLFSELDQLVEGDRFLIQVLDRTLTYEVDQIRIVLPNELQDLAILEDQDLVTLVTCTPYGVNTHRLLVRGHRVETEGDDTRVVADAVQIEPVLVAPLVAAPILLLLLIMLLISTSGRSRKKREEAKKRAQLAAVELAKKR